MGGPGSGRLLRFNTKPKVERQTYIDIRWMKRQNGLIPGTTGTSALSIVWRAVILSPMVLIAKAEGPIKSSPSFLQRFENSAFSDNSLLISAC